MQTRAIMLWWLKADGRLLSKEKNSANFLRFIPLFLLGQCGGSATQLVFKKRYSYLLIWRFGMRFKFEYFQQVIYGIMPPEAFTGRLQMALRSQAQPHLLPFLQKVHVVILCMHSDIWKHTTWHLFILKCSALSNFKPSDQSWIKHALNSSMFTVFEKNFRPHWNA